MKKILTLFCVCFAITAIAKDSIPAKLVKNSLLLDIAATSNVFVAVGERGHVLIGKDLSNAKQVTVPTRATLTAVSTQGDNIWAVGHDLTIIHSSDGGETWTLQFIDEASDKPFLDVLFIDEQQGVAIGAYGAFYRTLDGGLNWQKELHASLLNPFDIEYLEEIREFDGEEFYQEELANILPHLNRIELFNEQMYLVGEMGLVATSTNLGKSWQRLEIPYEGSLFALAMTNNGLLVTGLRGNTFLQSDIDWFNLDLCHSVSVNSLINGDDQIIALANNGYISTISINKIDSDVTCSSGDINTKQTASKVSLLNGVFINNDFLTVAANGLQILEVQ